VPPSRQRGGKVWRLRGPQAVEDCRRPARLYSRPAEPGAQLIGPEATTLIFSKRKAIRLICRRFKQPGGCINRAGGGRRRRLS
jgi:hypothetical protein